MIYLVVETSQHAETPPCPDSPPCSDSLLHPDSLPHAESQLAHLQSNHLPTRRVAHTHQTLLSRRCIQTQIYFIVQKNLILDQ